MADLLRIAALFIIILVLLRRSLHTGVVMLIASGLLAVFYLMPPRTAMAALRNTALSHVTIKLVLSLSLIRIFELMLRERRVLAGMMETVKRVFASQKAVIISMPLLIGMLPSLGGAYFSAPMVKEATDGLAMDREEKAFINYWFRHPWECTLPLYPGILLAAAVSGVPLYHLITANSAYAAVLVATGFLLSMRGIGSKAEGSDERSGVWSGIASFLPIVAVLALVAAAHVELHFALVACILPMFFIYRYRANDVLRLLKYGFTAEVFVLIAGVMLFKETMELSGAVRNLSGFFLSQGIPTLPVVCALPFITGMLTGLTVAFVGGTFPLVMNVAGAGLPVITVAFAAGFIGVLLSPVHLCLVLTREYFKADMWGIYRKIIPASAAMFATVIAEYFLLRS